MHVTHTTTTLSIGIAELSDRLRGTFVTRVRGPLFCYAGLGFTLAFSTAGGGFSGLPGRLHPLPSVQEGNFPRRYHGAKLTSCCSTGRPVSTSCITIWARFTKSKTIKRS